MDSNLISIIMPAYNGEEFIQQALESVLDQSYPHWELIVVDDGSTDGTPDIVTGFSDDRIRYDRQENRGQAAALNRGLDLAQGEYITTLDVDDWYTPNSLQDRVHFLEKHPKYDVVYGDGYYCDLNSKPLMRFSEFRFGDVVDDVYEILIDTPIFNTGGNVTVRKQIFDQNHLRYDESIFWCQDWDFLIRVSEHAKFGYVDSNLLWYRLSEGNMTMSPKFEEMRFESLVRMKNKVINSPIFSQLSIPGKSKFFESFLTLYLQDRINHQFEVVKTEQFQSLPKRQRAKLFRRVAIDYLVRGNNTDNAKRWSKMAWSMYPLSIKTGMITLLIHINSNLAMETIRIWRKTSENESNFLDPIQLASQSS